MQYSNELLSQQSRADTTKTPRYVNCQMSRSAFLLCLARILVLVLLSVKNTGNGWYR